MVRTDEDSRDGADDDYEDSDGSGDNGEVEAGVEAGVKTSDENENENMEVEEGAVEEEKDHVGTVRGSGVGEDL